jgi:hypothetical protein
MDFALDNLKSKLGSKNIIPDLNQAKNSLKYAWPALRLALTVFEKTLDSAPIPGLKGTVGGILELAKTEEVITRSPIRHCHDNINDHCLGADTKHRGRPRAPDTDNDAYLHFETMG